MDILKKEKQMKKLITCTIMVLLMILSVSCKEKKSMQEEFDYYIENEDFEGIKKLEGKYFKYENTRRFDNQLLSQSFSIFSNINFSTEKAFKLASIEIYTNKTKPNLSIIYTKFTVSPKKKPKNYKGADSFITDIQLLQCRDGYEFFIDATCCVEENGKIKSSSDHVFTIRELKTGSDGLLENVQV